MDLRKVADDVRTKTTSRSYTVTITGVTLPTTDWLDDIELSKDYLFTEFVRTFPETVRAEATSFEVEG